jgi:transcription elongation factor SPT6
MGLSKHIVMQDDEHHSEIEGEEIVENKATDSEEEDSENEEITEADIRFIASESEDDEVTTKRKKKRRRITQDSELDEDDLDLIEHNLGIPKTQSFKKLRKKKEKTKAVTLDNLFSDTEQPQEDDDDMENFIASEEDDDHDRLRIRKEKRKPIAADLGVSEDVWRDIQDIFGDGTDYDWALQFNNALDLNDQIDDDLDLIAPKKQPLKLTDIYEPAEIKEKMLTEEDEIIRITDIPERFQIQYNSTEQVSEIDIQRESLYISRILMDERGDYRRLEESPYPKYVQNVLRFLKNEHFEVPFIFAHRKDHLRGHLDRNLLWRVYDLDIQYESLQSRLKKLRTLYQDLSRGSDDVPGIGSDTHVEKWLNAISIMSTERMSDIQQYLQMKYGTTFHALEQQKKKTFKKARKRSPYDEAIKAGLGDFVKLFGVNVDAYAQSIISQTSVHSPSDPSQTPEEAATQFVSPLYPNPAAVLEGARQVLAQDIAYHPDLRNFIRNVFKGDGVVTVEPTDKGRNEITTQHPYYVPLDYN